MYSDMTLCINLEFGGYSSSFLVLGGVELLWKANNLS